MKLFLVLQRRPVCATVLVKISTFIKLAVALLSIGNLFLLEHRLSPPHESVAEWNVRTKIFGIHDDNKIIN